MKQLHKIDQAIAKRRVNSIAELVLHTYQENVRRILLSKQGYLYVE